MSIRQIALALSALATVMLSLTAQAAPRTGFASRADALLKGHLRAGNFSGVVLVARHGKTLLRQGYGLADREQGVLATPETVFRIGSTTKPFTATAVMTLVEGGKVSLDSPIRRYVDGLPAAWSAITVRQLLNHSSGIPDYVQVNGFIRGPARLNLTPGELVGLVRNEPLEFTPGAKFHYSNTGYALLGMMIERITGQSYPDYVRDHLLRPAGLTHTAYDNPEDIVPGRASGYWLVDGIAKNARLMTPSAAYAAGGLRSTVDDLLRWNVALHAGKLVNAASLAAMFTDAGHGYGLGSFVEVRRGHRLWDHGGNLPGFSCAFEYYPDDDLTVIVLTNIEGEGSEHIASELAGAYFG
ncbi:serine hydrolase domain-containing protein [Sphingomonas aerophila]|uniref:CubicO group peptidase (Beta-lactamase class C family) n=1 Tax=Sphingomonas aerophila TaxID=1344948 RepID=A0A7W9BGY8_9SPHN|nr:serine hydrolase domain-containing protein [Sphingomonas aerophila]MBB5716957.1 CubicO group peptidase (beta-lactamase class C family) [Sphingomonas aerophila]